MSKATKNLFPEDEFEEIEETEEGTVVDETDLVSPFDPKDIKIIVEPKTIDHLVTRLRYEEIDLNTEFQRKGNLWNPGAQSRLIESILLRLPLPAFYFDAEDESNWLVVDGLQRLWTIKNFVVNSEINDEDNIPLQLTGLEILKNYSDKGITYNKLNRAMQRRILETPITTYLIQPGTPKQVKYNVFRRINTGGLGLNSMEIRNALNQGKPANYLRDLSESEDLKAVLKVRDKRMDDRELLLRAIAYIQKDYKNYEQPLSVFLDNAMELLYKADKNELTKMTIGIIEAIQFQKELFGKHSFSRSILGSNYRIKLNSALFEVWVSLSFNLGKRQKENMIFLKNNLIDDYIELMLNEEFLKAVVSSTSSKNSVKIRFEKIKNLIKKYS